MLLRLDVLDTATIIVPLDITVTGAVAPSASPGLLRKTLAPEELDEAIRLDHLQIRVVGHLGNCGFNKGV
jgi:hypothetical protein